jgi:hypothetical protein
MDKQVAEIETNTFLQLGCDRCPSKCVIAAGGLAGMHAVALMSENGAPRLPYMVAETVGVTVDGDAFAVPQVSKKYGHTEIAPAGGQCATVCEYEPVIERAADVATVALGKLGLAVERMDEV